MDLLFVACTSCLPINNGCISNCRKQFCISFFKVQGIASPRREPVPIFREAKTFSKIKFEKGWVIVYDNLKCTINNSLLFLNHCPW